MDKSIAGWTPVSPQRILMVDDEVSIGQLVARVLEDHGYAVTLATSGEAALEKMQLTAYDLVITDLRMPGMDGLSLASHCQRMYPHTRSIILTAHGSIQNAVDAMKLGITDYLVKPFSIQELTRKVKASLAARPKRDLSPTAVLLQSLIELGRIQTQSDNLTQTMERIESLLAETYAPLAGMEITVFGADPEGDLVFAHKGSLLEDSEQARPTRDQIVSMAQDAAPWLLDARGMRLTVPILSGDQVIGQVTVARGDDHAPFATSDCQLLHVFGSQIGLAILQAQTRQRLLETFRDLEKANVSTVESLFAALETYDSPTQRHSRRVARYAFQLGRELGLANDYLETLRIGGLLHDIGKIGIGEGTIRKNGALDATERERVMLHPIMGERILSGIDAFKQVSPLVLYHHERFDGKGYPAQLAGEDIPLGARIIAIVDTFDSITSERPYHAAESAEQALATLVAGAGTQFDLHLVDVWCLLWPGLQNEGMVPATDWKAVQCTSRS